MTGNPYHSTSTVPDGSSVRPRSLRVYVLASLIVVAIWFNLVGAIAWLGNMSIDDGQVSVEFMDHLASPTGFDDLDVSTSIYMFYADIAGVTLLLGIAVLVSLAIVNGFIAFWRYKQDV